MSPIKTLDEMDADLDAIRAQLKAEPDARVPTTLVLALLDCLPALRELIEVGRAEGLSRDALDDAKNRVAHVYEVLDQLARDSATR